jgi:hypothetical protein
MPPCASQSGAAGHRAHGAHGAISGHPVASSACEYPAVALQRELYASASWGHDAAVAAAAPTDLGMWQMAGALDLHEPSSARVQKMYSRAPQLVPMPGIDS